ncbi:uncharacterized protein LOC143857007 [Tasmannia lanceolata]|uniref:uncharacterized protein LOC143857007 n=1 Tax=Tasmannia lanceolata TaxID=3420 RepID=UPI0040641C92
MEEIASRTHSPWLLIGDFNVVRFSNERFGGATAILSDMEEFNSCLLNCALTDLKASGHNLTWNNRAKSGPKKFAKLDRVLVNDYCILSHHLSQADFHSPGISDHSQITVSFNPHTPNGHKPSRFLNMWLQDTSLYPIVEYAWSKEVYGNPMFRLSQKLKEVKYQIKCWNREVFGRIDIKVPLIRKSLEETQHQLSSDPANSDLIEEE